MLCLRQGSGGGGGGGGHKGRLSGLGASPSCSASIAPFLLLCLLMPSLHWDFEAVAIGGVLKKKKKGGERHTHTNKSLLESPSGLATDLTRSNISDFSRR